MQHVFHVHTARCKHGSDESDEAFVKTAVALGASKITFTDHSPFPGDSFKNRMDMRQLPEYIESLKSLRDKYRGTIEIEIGLEIEFLPSMMDYYAELKKNEDLSLLMIGQHFYEHTGGGFSFTDDKEFNKMHECFGCGDAMIEGMESGLFMVAAHPDRIFRRRKVWTDEMTELSKRIIEAAVKNNVTLERNLSSYEKYCTKKNPCYWKNEFWELVSEYNKSAANPAKIIEGLDAHSTEEMRRRWELKNRLV